MKWYKALWKTKARRYFLIGALIASGIGAPAAVSIGTAIDQGIEQIESADDSRD
jgi:hypothetical protein